MEKSAGSSVPPAVPLAWLLSGPFWDAGEAWFYRLNPSIPVHEKYVHEHSSLRPSGWYSPPRGAFLALLLGLFLSLPAVICACSRRKWRRSPIIPVVVGPPAEELRAGDKAGAEGAASSWAPALAFIDYAQRALLSVCFLMTLGYKIYGPVGGPAFLLMPCHILTAATLYAAFFLGPARGEFATRFFSVLLVHGWAAMLALAFPDTKPLVSPLEVPHFFVYHIVLITLPLTWALRGTFHFSGGLETLATAWGVNSFISSVPTLLMDVLLGGINVGYMMVPPSIVSKALGSAGPLFFRAFFGMVVLPTFIFAWRFLFLNAFFGIAAWCSGGACRVPSASELGEEGDDETAFRKKNDDGSPRAVSATVKAASK